MEDAMIGKRCLYFILISILAFTAAETNAEDQFNITCITQYYHNWTDGVHDVAVKGNHAYLACGAEGLWVVDVSNPDAISDVSNVSFGFASAIAIQGNYAYVGTYSNGVYIVDISDPAELVTKAQIPVHAINKIKIDGNVAYICSRYNGLNLVDISSPDAPRTLWSTTDVYECYDVDIHDNIAYVPCDYDRLMVLDVTDVSSPQIIDEYDMNENVGACVSGNYAYLACGFRGFRIMDLTTRQEVAAIDSLFYAYGVKMVGNLVYVHYGEFDCPLAVVDVSNPLSPQTIGVYYPPMDLLNFTIVDNTVYVADFYDGLRLVDISDPTNPYEFASYNRYGYDLDVTVSGNYAYVRENYKLKIIDISNLEDPQEVGYYELNWYGDLQMVGNTAFITSHGYTCIEALDLTDPTAITLLGTFTVEDSDIHYRLAARSDYAYMVENSGLRILDISNPQNIQEVGYFNRNMGNAFTIVAGRYAFLEDDAIVALDLIDPLSPSVVGEYYIDHYCTDMKCVDGMLYVATPYSLYIFDTEDFNNWAPLSITYTDNASYGYIQGIDVSENYVYLATGAHGLCVFDVSDPATPVLTGYIETPGIAKGVSAKAGIAVVADDTNLGIYNCMQAVPAGPSAPPVTPAAFTLYPNFPNPFNASTQIQFDVPASSHVTMQIFDILGRNVTTLADTRFTAGQHTLRWDGTNFNGQTVASGRYFVQLRAGDAMHTMPIVFMK